MGSQGDKYTVTWLIYIIIVFKNNTLEKYTTSQKLFNRERKTVELVNWFQDLFTVQGNDF